jgi:bifunctional non-homologous end joining protein LigD
MAAQIAEGKISVTMRGERMKGSWSFVKTKQAEDTWLLLKHRDDAADGRDLPALFDASVISGFTIADLQAGRLPPTDASPAPLRASELAKARRSAMPANVEPMQATLSSGPFAHDDWSFEPKLDGVRALARFEDGRVTLTSRRGNDMTGTYPTVAAAVAKQPANSMILDGEIVAFDEHGVPSFERLQSRINLTNPTEIRQADRDLPVTYYVFDLLYLDGVDVRRAPLEARRALLRRTIMPTPHLRLVEPFEVDGLTAYEAATTLGIEGLLAKRRDSAYESGKRSPSWLKVKHRTSDDFVVVGYSDGLNSRSSTFGALVIATRDEAGTLRAVGRVGSGFDERTLRAFLDRLAPLRVPEPPLEVTRDQAAGVTWVRPEIVVEVEYAQVTADGSLRASVFLRLRDDKTPDDVMRAATVAPPKASSGATKRYTAIRTSRLEAARAARPPEPAPSTPAGDLPHDLPHDLDAQIASVIAQVEAAKKQATIEVAGAQIAVTNLDKVMWPAHHDSHGETRALTKRDLIAYYARMAPYLLPQLRDRPLTMTRYPNGIDAPFFYQKHVEALPAGGFVQTLKVFMDSRDQEAILVNNLPTLVWLAQVADLALHTSLARANPAPDAAGVPQTFAGSKEAIEASLLNRPDFVLFDLDPYIYRGDEAKGGEPELNRRAFEQTAQVARWLKELLDSARMSSFIKTSGATGLHIFVPVVREYEYDVIREVAQTLGAFLVRAHPKEVTTEWATEKRKGMVFFDANQNARIKNLACAYSPRAKPGGPVSMPLKWDELDRIFPTDFTMLNAYERVAKVGDLWAHILDAKHDLSALLGR